MDRREYDRLWYQSHKKEVVDRAKGFNQQKMERLQEYRKTVRCSICERGENLRFQYNGEMVELTTNHSWEDTEKQLRMSKVICLSCIKKQQCSEKVNKEEFIGRRICFWCKVEKPLEEFAWENKQKGLRHHRCKECQRTRSKDHYKGNKESYKEITRISRERGRKFLDEYLAKHPCVDCGESNIKVLDFDHRRDKKFGLAGACCQTIPILEAEVAKCEVRCGNCHRRKTVTQVDGHKIYMLRGETKNSDQYSSHPMSTRQREQRKILFSVLLEYLKEHPCTDCGQNDPVVLEFDHLPGEEKKYEIAAIMSQSLSISTLKAEIAKCDVCCVNCHRKRTNRRRKEEVTRQSF